jgi:uncharacterized protein (DUF1800 family)
MGMSARARRHWASLFVGLGFTSATVVSAQSLSHAPDQLFHDGMEGVSAGPFNDADASRFLAQATFGPTNADIAYLRTKGYQAWLNEQFNSATTVPTYQITDQPGHLAYLNWVNGKGEPIGQDNRTEAWFLGALGGHDPQAPGDPTKDHKDQLRQRVAFALSEILVISDQNTELGLNGAAGMAHFYDILSNNAFGNYRVLLEQVTLTPAMGVYLNMLGNRRADLANNVHPDENYGREINQLFSIGLVMLNQDGTVPLSGGKPTPTYTQNTITNFAHVLTGWNWASCDANGYDNFIGCYTLYNTPSDYITPMVAYETRPPSEAAVPYFDFNYHDNGTHTDDVHNKQLLAYFGAINGGVLPDGVSAYSDGSAAGDLKFALDNIYNHPNVGPFICKQLIQRLVTSNPSPAYVGRVTSVFNANRASPIQLQAVVQAILLDPEARYGQWWNSDTFGKLREPLLALTHLWRGMGAQHACGLDVTTGNVGYYANQPYRYAGYNTAWSTGGTQYGGIAQAPQDAFTVFNFFKPSFLPPGEMANRSLFGPEYQLQTDSVIALSANTFGGFYIPYDVTDSCDPGDVIGEVKINHTQDLALAGSGNGGAADPSDALVDAYNKRFMSGQMSPFMRQTLIDYLNGIDSSWVYPLGSYDWRVIRINRALYLIFTSPEYMVQK